MNAIELLKEFAKEKGIDENEVDAFIEKRKRNPKTLNDIINMPYDLKTHYSDVFALPDTIRAFVDKEMDYIPRHKVVDTDRLVGVWCDRTDDIMKDRYEDLWGYTLEKIEQIEPESEAKKEEMDFLKEVAKAIFSEKFGSFKNDW